jgi:hypothetical protein
MKDIKDARLEPAAGSSACCPSTLAYGTGFLTAATFAPGEAPRFLVAGRLRDWQLLMGAGSSGSDEWLC